MVHIGRANAIIIGDCAFFLMAISGSTGGGALFLLSVSVTQGVGKLGSFTDSTSKGAGFLYCQQKKALL